MRVTGRGSVFCAATSLLVAGTLAAPLPKVSAAPAPSCFPPHSKTLAASKTTHVFETRRGTYGCLFRYGQARRLDPDKPRVELEATAYRPFRFAGPYVAFVRLESQGCGIGVCDWTDVVVADLRPTRPLILHEHYAAADETLADYQGPVDEGAQAEAFVTDLVLLRSGTVAWIECEGYTPGPCDNSGPDPNDPRYEPRKRTAVFVGTTKRRKRTKLDQGETIDKRSLSWRAGVLHWRAGGKTRSAAVR